jgi:hypothetical protein
MPHREVQRVVVTHLVTPLRVVTVAAVTHRAQTHAPTVAAATLLVMPPREETVQTAVVATHPVMPRREVQRVVAAATPRAQTHVQTAAAATLLVVTAQIPEGHRATRREGTVVAATHLVMPLRVVTVQTVVAATPLVTPLQEAQRVVVTHLVTPPREVLRVAAVTPRVMPPREVLRVVAAATHRAQTHAPTVAAASHRVVIVQTEAAVMVPAVMTRAAHLAAKRAVLSPAVTQLVARVRHPRAVAMHREIPAHQEVQTLVAAVMLRAGTPEAHRAAIREVTVPPPVATPAPLPVEPREAHHAAHPVTHREARPVVARQVENRVPAHTAPRNTRLAKQARLPDPDNKLYNAKRQWLS